MAFRLSFHNRLVNLFLITAGLTILSYCGSVCSSDASPKPVGQPLLCEGCMAVVSELHKKLKESQGRKRLVNDAMNNLCHTDNFLVYKFSPPKMVKACDYLMGTHRKDLEESAVSFYRKYRVQEPRILEEEFCDKKAKACHQGQRQAHRQSASPVGMNLEEANEKLRAPGSPKSEEEEPTLTLEAPPVFTTTRPKEEL